jgi:hypothetical protein
MKTNSISLQSLLAALALCLAAPLAHAQFAASTGFDYTSGDYGLSIKTKISTWAITGEYSYDGWTARLYAPYERVTSPVGVVVISGHPRLEKRINALNQGKTQSESGLSDVEASLSYNALKSEKTDWSAVFTGSVKLPTGDEDKGLGSGKTDYGIAFDLSRAIDRFTPSIGIGYRLIGNPSGADLKNYLYGTVGLGYWVTDATNLALTFESDQRSSASSSVDNELSCGLNHHLAKGWDLEAHVLAGLSQAAPDFGLGASVRCSF